MFRKGFEEWFKNRAKSRWDKMSDEERSEWTDIKTSDEFANFAFSVVDSFERFGTSIKESKGVRQ